MARRWARFFVLVVVLGGAFGVADRLVDGWTTWGTYLSNASALWVVGAFLLGSRSGSPVRAAVTGLLFVVSALAGYYGYMHVVQGGANAAYVSHVAVIWLLFGLPGGPAVGAAGHHWQRTHSRVTALVMPVALVGDGALLLVLPWVERSLRPPGNTGPVYGHASLLVICGAQIVAGAALAAWLLRPRQAGLAPAGGR